MKLRETYPGKFLRNQAEGKKTHVKKNVWVQKAEGNEAHSLHVGDVKLRETYPNKFLRNQAEGK